MNLAIFLPILLLFSQPVPKNRPVALVIVAHPSVAQTDLSRAELKNIFLGKKRRWEDGSDIVAVTTTGTTHKAFLTNYLDQDPKRFRAYWQRMIFTGSKLPPKAISREDIALEYIARTPGAIGYVSAQLPLDRVQQLDITP